MNGKVTWGPIISFAVLAMVGIFLITTVGIAS